MRTIFSSPQAQGLATWAAPSEGRGVEVFSVGGGGRVGPEALLGAFRDFLRRVEGMARGDVGWHGELHRWVRFVHAAYLRGDLGRDELEAWRGELGVAFNGVQTCQGLAWGRSRGPGLDPAVLDRIESRWTSSDAGLAKWDDLFHGDLAIRAVRNRRERFQSWLAVREERAGGRPVRVLDLGCGPGWPIAAHLAEHPSGGARFVAVDSNPEVLARAAQVCRGGAGRVDFVCADPARYVPVGRGVDLVWSGGMLERLSDRLAVVVLGRIWEMLPVGGEFVLGNLAAGNPSRAYLEVMLGWSAYHRSAEDLEELARHAGIPAGATEVGAERLGVGLFLRARKGG